LVIALTLLASPLPLRAAEPPVWLPRYDLDIRIDPDKRLATVKQRVTFTNRHERPATELTFNAHARYTIPDDDVGFMAKMAEILRIAPKEGFYFDGPPMDIRGVSFIDTAAPIQRTSHRAPARGRECRFEYGDKNPCSFTVALPRPVAHGESVTVEIDFVFRIPAKKGRWSHWEGITALAQWLPTLAVYDNDGWHALPFIPWHQPFYNEAGVYTARVTLPADQKLAAPMPVRSQREVSSDPIPAAPNTVQVAVQDGWVEYDFEPAVLRDFSLTCSNRYMVTECMGGRIKVRCLHLPEHEHYAKVFAATACQAIPVYEKWFGPYPYAQFTIAEACFGWNGNECSAMVLIDERMFNMPHIAKAYPTYLLQHELCHQWFYNIIGTNGYAETFLDEGFATYFSHKLADATLGKNNAVIEYPTGLGWLPNIHREDLRFYGMIGSRARGEIYPTVQPIDKFGHLAALMANTYDRGGKIMGQIEARLGGEEAMIDFMRGLYQKYAFQILRVADLQRELETYTGRSWDDFFQHWVYGTGVCDWKVSRVEIDGRRGPLARFRHKDGPVQIAVDLLEQEGYPEPTVLGVQFTHEKDRFDIRIPIDPSVPVAEYPDLNARVESTIIEGHKPGSKKFAVRVTFTSPRVPKQMVVDPDRVLIDLRTENNAWIPHINWRPTPLYTMLDEVDVTNSYDRWSVIFGPWIGTSTTTDPWYTRSPLFGAKVGVVRIQELTAGAFVGYRTNDRNVVAGVEGLWSHVCDPNFYVGFNLEQALTVIDDSPRASRGVIFGRYVMTSSSSLYLPPFEYFEAFAAAQSHPFPNMPNPPPGADPFYERRSLGIHYHKFYLTPYWDPEGGVATDVSYQYGMSILGADRGFHQAQGQVSTVKSFPELLTRFSDGPISAWLRQTRLAFRFAGGAATPQDGQLFSLGGGDHFRGFDISERQGSLVWLCSVEWRVPVFQNCKYDVFDHIAGVRNVYLAPFYDVGQAYLSGRGVGGDIAQAVGLGLRVDVQWIAIIERTMLRMDVAQAINLDTPTQFWFGIQHPF
jgi:hypothetical protein